MNIKVGAHLNTANSVTHAVAHDKTEGTYLPVMDICEVLVSPQINFLFSTSANFF